VNLHLGVNYDTCHFAVEFEDPIKSLQTFQAAGIRISKLHLSSALRCAPGPETTALLGLFADQVYLHQVLGRRTDGTLVRHRDLPMALAQNDPVEELRVHFHVPLYAELAEPLATTIDHVTGTLDWLPANPGGSLHLEIETYTWQVLPDRLRTDSLVDQLTREYQWVLAQMRERNLA
jgi:hypothetical protein